MSYPLKTKEFFLKKESKSLGATISVASLDGIPSEKRKRKKETVKS